MEMVIAICPVINPAKANIAKSPSVSAIIVQTIILGNILSKKIYKKLSATETPRQAAISGAYCWMLSQSPYFKFCDQLELQSLMQQPPIPKKPTIMITSTGTQKGSLNFLCSTGSDLHQMHRELNDYWQAEQSIGPRSLFIALELRCFMINIQQVIQIKIFNTLVTYFKISIYQTILIKIKTCIFITLYLEIGISMAQKISNPFHKPSPFRVASPFEKPSNNNTSYSNANFYESNVAPYVSSMNNQFSQVPASNNYYKMNQYNEMKPTRDYEFSKDTGIETLLLKNPFKKANLLDGANLNPTYNNYIDFGSNKYMRNQNIGYQHLEHYPTTHHFSNFHDNKSDAGSVNTYINKIYQIQDHNKYSGYGNPEKLSNPFGRKHLITTQNHIQYDDTSDYGLTKNCYNPGLNMNNYIYKKDDYSSVELPQMKLNFDYEGSSVGTPKAKGNRFDIEIDRSGGYLENGYKDSQMPPHYSKNTQSQKNIKIDGRDEYENKKVYSQANEQQRKMSRYDSRLEVPYDQTFKMNGYQKNEESDYNYRINYQDRHSRQNVESRVEEYGNYYPGQKVQFEKNSDYEPQQDEQSYKPPAFGGSRKQNQISSRNVLDGVARPKVPKVIKFDADQSEQSRIRPDIYQSRKEQAVRQGESYPSILQIKGRLYHKIETA